VKGGNWGGGAVLTVNLFFLCVFSKGAIGGELEDVI